MIEFEKKLQTEAEKQNVESKSSLEQSLAAPKWEQLKRETRIRV